MNDIDERDGNGDAAGDDVDLDRVWVNVAAEVWCRSPGRLERSAARLLAIARPGPGAAHHSVAAAAVADLQRVVLGVGVAAEVSAGQPLVWLIAPVLAAVGMAYAYGPGVDPAWELSCSMPISDRLVLLTRAVAVFAVNAVLGLVASVATLGTRASADAAPVTFGWLIPMAAVCALTLAVAVAVRSASVGVGAGVARLDHPRARRRPTARRQRSQLSPRPPASPTRTSISPTWRSRPAAPPS